MEGIPQQPSTPSTEERRVNLHNELDRLIEARQGYEQRVTTPEHSEGAKGEFESYEADAAVGELKGMDERILAIQQELNELQ